MVVTEAHYLTEEHGYLSLETDNMVAERVSAAEPLGVLVLPARAYGPSRSFAVLVSGRR